MMFWIITCFSLFVISFKNCQALPEVIHIGAIFDSEDETYEKSFYTAITQINRDREILRRSRLVPIIEKISPHDLFEAERRVCALLSAGVIAIFGPQSQDTSLHVQNICDTKGIIHIETHWDTRLKKHNNAINIYPHLPSLGLAYKDLINHYQWTKFAVLYENDEGMMRLGEIFHNPIKPNISISAHKLSEDGDYRKILRTLKIKRFRDIILDCKTSQVYNVLKQSQQIGMMTDKYNYILTTLDLDTVDVEDFKYSNNNITAFRIVDPNHPEVKRIIEYNPGGEHNNHFKFSTEIALIYDAVYLFATTLHNFEDKNRNHMRIPQVSCDSTDSWSHGDSLINAMKTTEISELSGPIMFDNNGFRSRYNLDIVQLSTKGVVPVGNLSLGKLKITEIPKIEEEEKADNNSIRFKNVTVTVFVTSPYVILKNSTKVLTGNDRYEGFCIDIIDRIAQMLQFNYTIKEVENNSYTGIIGEVQNGVTDLAIGDLTITEKREADVDFTLPFMNLGISILYRRASPQPPNLLSFLSPFSLTVWLTMAGAYIIVSLMLFALARLSPTEWDNPFPCIQEPDALYNSFSLLNSLWFTIGSLMQQGSDIAPKASSTRMVAAIWWFFTLIMISSYTANLAAFLTFEQTVNPFNNIDELAAQTKIKYGAVNGGSTLAFFKNSKMEKFTKMYDYMIANKDEVMVAKNENGFQKVLNSNNYAFFLESTGLEYITERECNLTQIGGLIDSKGYGIALKEGSPYRSEISATILLLQEKEEISKLKEKWWKHKGGGKCVAGSSSTAEPLNLLNVGGIFVVLLAGMGLACIVAIFEFIWKLKSIPLTQRDSIGKELLKEFAFALQCANTRQVDKTKSSKEPSNNGDVIPMADYGT